MRIPYNHLGREYEYDTYEESEEDNDKENQNREEENNKYRDKKSGSEFQGESETTSIEMIDSYEEAAAKKQEEGDFLFD